MNAAETSASSAMADCTPLAVVSRSVMTAEIDTFISDVSTTRTNIAAASSSISRRLTCCAGLVPRFVESLICSSCAVAGRADSVVEASVNPAGNPGSHGPRKSWSVAPYGG